MYHYPNSSGIKLLQVRQRLDDWDKRFKMQTPLIQNTATFFDHHVLDYDNEIKLVVLSTTVLLSLLVLRIIISIMKGQRLDTFSMSLKNLENLKCKTRNAIRYT